MRLISVFFSLSILCASIFAAEQDQPTKKNLDWITKHPVILEVHERHNAARAAAGLQKLQLDPEMCLVAQRHATWMSETGWLAHSGHPYRENIFMGVFSAKDAVNGWIWSQPHYGNMLSGTKAGYGYQYINGRASWVGLFQ